MGGFIYGIRLTEVCTIYTKFGDIKTQVYFWFLETIHMLRKGASINKGCPIFRRFYLWHLNEVLAVKTKFDNIKIGEMAPKISEI